MPFLEEERRRTRLQESDSSTRNIEAIYHREAEAALKSNQAADKETARAKREEISAGFEKAIDEHLSPYLELYAVNPQKFAEMKTADFIKIVKQIEKTDTEVIRESKKLKEHIDNINILKRHIEAKHEIYFKHINDMVTYVINSLAESVEDIQEIETQFRTITNKDSFDTTPRQRMEQYVQLLESFTSRFEAKVDMKKKERQEFLDQHKATSSEQAHTLQEATTE